jgi:hypothetical protein
MSDENGITRNVELVVYNKCPKCIAFGT